MSFLLGGNEEKTYTIDLNKSKLRWVAKKLTGSHWGNIHLKSGIVKIKNNLPISGEFIVDMKTIEVMDTKESIWGKNYSPIFIQKISLILKIILRPDFQSRE